MRRHFSIHAFTAACVLLLAAPLLAQESRPDWDGKIVEEIVSEGFRRQNAASRIDRAGIRRGKPLTRELKDKAEKDLLETLKFDRASIRVEPHPTAPDRLRVIVSVKEYEYIEAVRFEGFEEISESELKQELRLGAGSSLNPFPLKLDHDVIRDRYVSKGYHFSEVRHELTAGELGVILTWTVAEGPQVSVEEIIFSGNYGIPASELRDVMKTKENGWLLFIPLGAEPFVERTLREDIKRLQLHYEEQGWLDIGARENIFVKDLLFSDDKTTVTIKIHIDEGPRYHVRDIRFRLDPSSRGILTEEELRSDLVTKPGDPFIRSNVQTDVSILRDRYGEKAYILARIVPDPVFAEEGHELDLVYAIHENEKIYVGRLFFEGNDKTREDVLRREFTRTGFLPGEEFNRKNLEVAQNRIRDRGLVEQMGGITYELQEGDLPNTRDVNVRVKEGRTGDIRFAAGYSSSYGVLGMFEFSQRNFDIADLPKSVADVVNGTGFAGGGQRLSLRLAPARRRQSYVVEFREPYVFGSDFGMTLRGYRYHTIRESYNIGRLGGRIGVDRRFGPFITKLSFEATEIEVDDLDDFAPRIVQEIEGLHRIFSLTPSLAFDTRDSSMFPTEGVRIELAYEYAGQILPGDFDFNKIIFMTHGHLTLYETESKLKHVATARTTFGRVRPARLTEDIPLFERFYCGGRSSLGTVRGFEYRGLGPHELGDPVGGKALAYGGLEYSFPIFSMQSPIPNRREDILRGAFFYDIANLTPEARDLMHEKWRNVVGFGIRFKIPQLGGIPVSLDFGFPLTKRDDDERQTVLFDIGKLF